MPEIDGVPYVAFGNDELNAAAPLAKGDMISCEECGGVHDVRLGKYEDGTESPMQLPPGKTCGDCVHCARCCALFGHVPSDTTCDFWPSRYHERRPVKRNADD